MVEEFKSHATTTSIVSAVPTEVQAGSEMIVKVRVVCDSQCNLAGHTVRIEDSDGGLIRQVELASSEGGTNETGEVVLQAPLKPGEYAWSISFQVPEKEGIRHATSMIPFSFVVKPHHSSLVLWDVPSPIVTNATLRVKVGVKCHANCTLAGERIEIFDQDGHRVASQALGASPWPGSSGLYWTEIGMQAPGSEGFFKWTAKFSKSALAMEHEETTDTFAFKTAKPPEHVVTVEVIDRAKRTPLQSAYVLLHPYSGYTDEAGVARVGVAKGTYELHVLKDDYAYFEMPAQVNKDERFTIELVYSPPLL